MHGTCSHNEYLRIYLTFQKIYCLLAAFFLFVCAGCIRYLTDKTDGGQFDGNTIDGTDGDHCAGDMCPKTCGDPDGGSCPPGCKAVVGYYYEYHCGCASLTSNTVFCRPMDDPCIGPPQLVQYPNAPSGYCIILEQGCGDDLPLGWLQDCCDLPATPAPEPGPWGCEGCSSDRFL